MVSFLIEYFVSLQLRARLVLFWPCIMMHLSFKTFLLLFIPPGLLQTLMELVVWL